MKTEGKRSRRVAEGSANYSLPRFLVSRAAVGEVVDEIARRFRPEKIIIFGSCARRNVEKAGDLDLLVIMESDLPQYKRAVPIRLLFDPAPCPMDILVYTPEEVDYWKGTPNHIVAEAINKGVVAYEKPSA